MSLVGTLSPEASKLVGAAIRHNEMIQVLNQSPLAKRFADEKKRFKELVHQYINSAGTKQALLNEMPKALNSEGTDRITAKINRFYKKHKPESRPADANALRANIKSVADQLVTTYQNLGSSNIGSDAKPETYKNYRDAKKAYKVAAKPLLTGKDKTVLSALKQTLNSKELGAKTVDKLDTFHGKFNKVKKAESSNNCRKVAYAVVVALVAAIAFSVLAKKFV